MKRSIQQLGIVPRLFPQVCSGEKTSTIRWQEPSIVPGELVYVCDGDNQQTVTVIVTRCTDMPLRDVAAFLGQSSQWPPEIMVAGMREHYPAITLEDKVQVIEHRLPTST